VYDKIYKNQREYAGENEHYAKIKGTACMDKLSFPFVSVIIPVYNDPVRLQTCLQALEEQTYPKCVYEVIVVDNGSDESITSIITQFSQVKTSYETRPGSYAARNKGLSLARGEVIAFTDSDCIPAPDWIERGVTKLQSIPNCGIVGGKIEMFFKDPHHPTAVEIYDSMTYFKQKEHIEQDEFSVTANLFTFKHVFDHIGRFDSELKSGGDWKWGRRVASFRYTLAYADDVRVAHPARHSLAGWITRERRVAKGIAILDRKWKKKEPPPPLTWSYESIMAHLPPLPPVIKTMRLKNISFTTKVGIIGLWFAIRYIRMEEKLRKKLKLLAKSIR